MAVLKAANGPNANSVYPLGGEKVVMGRHPECDIVIDVGAVSRHHAQVVALGDDYFVEDLNSRNGTYLNDAIVEGRRKLAPGDRVRVCDVSFLFLDNDMPPQPSPGDGFATVMMEDEGLSTSSTIMSKLNVSSTHGAVHVAASAEVKLQALLEITSSLGGVISLDEVLPQVLESLFKIFVQADRGFIVLRDDGGNLVARWTKLRRADADDTICISRTIVHQVMETKEAILSADAASDSRFELSQSIADFRIRSMMCAPLVDSRGDAFGVLQIDTLDQRNRLRPEDLEVLVAVAGQASRAIDNARLHEQALQQRELARDLELAHEVQHALLPSRAPEIPGYEFYQYYEPANHVGGDYYDFVPLADGRVAAIVADVVGHGIAAALIMSKLSADVRFNLALQIEPAAALTAVNASLEQLEDRFVTFIMVIIDPASHQLTVVNAGHMPPIVRRADGSLEEVGDELAGLPLGVSQFSEYEPFTCQLAPGELFLLYTDGVNEAMNPGGEQFGMEPIRRSVIDYDDATSVGGAIIAEVNQFMGSASQNDDMCLVCVGRKAE